MLILINKFLKIFQMFAGEKLNTPSWSFKQRYNRVSGDAHLHSTRKQDKNILN